MPTGSVTQFKRQHAAFLSQMEMIRTVLTALNADTTLCSEIATECGVHKSTVYRWRTNGVTYPHIDVLLKIASRYGYTIKLYGEHE